MLCLLRRQWAFSDCVVQIEPPVSEMHMPLPRHCCGIIATANLVEVVLCMIYNLYPRAVVTRDEDKPDDVLVHEELPEFDIVAKLMEGLRIRLLPEMRTLYVHMITCTNMTYSRCQTLNLP